MNKIPYLILIAVSIVLDQLSKWAVTQHMIKPALRSGYGEPLEFWPWLTTVTPHLPFTSIEILPFINIVMVWNKGVSFGMFNDGGEMGALILIALSLVIVFIFLIWLFTAGHYMQRLSIALVIGGAIGNVIDRARLGAVVDFIDVHAFGYHWPAFNIADSCIVIGVFLLIIYSFFFETQTKDVK